MAYTVPVSLLLYLQSIRKKKKDECHHNNKVSNVMRLQQQKFISCLVLCVLGCYTGCHMLGSKQQSTTHLFPTAWETGKPNSEVLNRFGVE